MLETEHDPQEREKKKREEVGGGPGLRFMLAVAVLCPWSSLIVARRAPLFNNVVPDECLSLIIERLNMGPMMRRWRGNSTHIFLSYSVAPFRIQVSRRKCILVQCRLDHAEDFLLLISLFCRNAETEKMIYDVRSEEFHSFMVRCQRLT